MGDFSLSCYCSQLSSSISRGGSWPRDQPCPSEAGGKGIMLSSEGRQAGRARPAGLHSWQKVVVQMGFGPEDWGARGGCGCWATGLGLELSVLLGKMFSV